MLISNHRIILCLYKIVCVYNKAYFVKLFFITLFFSKSNRFKFISKDICIRLQYTAKQCNVRILSLYILHFSKIKIGDA